MIRKIITEGVRVIGHEEPSLMLSRVSAAGGAGVSAGDWPGRAVPCLTVGEGRKVGTAHTVGIR